jgi:hypothetical protein
MLRFADSVVRKALLDEEKNWALDEQALNEAKDRAQRLHELKGTAQIVLSLQRAQRSRVAPKRFTEANSPTISPAKRKTISPAKRKRVQVKPQVRVILPSSKWPRKKKAVARGHGPKPEKAVASSKAQGPILATQSGTIATCRAQLRRALGREDRLVNDMHWNKRAKDNPVKLAQLVLNCVPEKTVKDMATSMMCGLSGDMIVLVINKYRQEAIRHQKELRVQAMRQLDAAEGAALQEQEQNCLAVDLCGSSEEASALDADGPNAGEAKDANGPNAGEATNANAPNAGEAKDAGGPNAEKPEPHWIRSRRALTGFKGVSKNYSSHTLRYRVKWAGSTHSRHATLSEACEEYYRLAQNAGALTVTENATDSVLDSLTYDE